MKWKKKTYLFYASIACSRNFLGLFRRPSRPCGFPTGVCRWASYILILQIPLFLFQQSFATQHSFERNLLKPTLRWKKQTKLKDFYLHLMHDAPASHRTFVSWLHALLYMGWSNTEDSYHVYWPLWLFFVYNLFIH